MKLRKVRIEIAILRRTFFLLKNLGDFVVSFEKLFPSRLQGEFLGHKFFPSGLVVDVKVASPTELNPYLSTFVGALQRAGENLTVSVQLGHTKYRIIGCKFVVLPLQEAGARHQTIKTADPAPIRCVRREVASEKEAVSGIRRRQPKTSDKDFSSKGRVERSFKDLGSPLLPLLFRRRALLLSARDDSPDDAA